MQPPSSLAQPLFASRDKNPRQLRIEYQTKRLAQILRRAASDDVAVVERRSRGLVLVNWQKAAQVVVPTAEDGVPSVQFKRSVLETNRLNPDQIKEAFDAQAVPVSAEEWCG